MFFKRRKKKEPPFWQRIPSPVAIIILLLGLGLAFTNLVYMTEHTGSVVALWTSLDQLSENYRLNGRGRRAPMMAELKEMAEKLVIEKESEAPRAVVVYSVISYREGERETLAQRLAAPLVDYYHDAGGEPRLDVVLIERKNAGSKDVNVRLFFSDGTEERFLWPRTHSEDGWWLPPCVIQTSNGEEKACPARFLGTYPEITTLLTN